MSAERHALNAALEYATKLEAELNGFKKALYGAREENRRLKNQVRRVRNACDFGPPEVSENCFGQKMAKNESYPSDGPTDQQSEGETKSYGPLR